MALYLEITVNNGQEVSVSGVLLFGAGWLFMAIALLVRAGT